MLPRSRALALLAGGIAATGSHSASSQTAAPVRNTFATSLEPRYAQPLLDLAFKFKLIDKNTNAADLFWSPPA